MIFFLSSCAVHIPFSGVIFALYFLRENRVTRDPWKLYASRHARPQVVDRGFSDFRRRTKPERSKKALNMMLERKKKSRNTTRQIL